MAYYIASGATLFFLAVIWDRHSWLNLFLKLWFFGAAGWASFLALQCAGYIVRS